MLETEVAELKETIVNAKSNLDDALSTIDQKEQDLLRLEKELDIPKVN